MDGSFNSFSGRTVSIPSIMQNISYCPIGSKTKEHRSIVHKEILVLIHQMVLE